MHGTQQILEHIEATEQRVLARLRLIEGRLCDAPDVLGFFGEALRRERERHQGASRDARLALLRLLSDARHDPALGYPHVKIVEALSRQQDERTGAPAELAFSRLVREARVSKGRAGRYLAVLEAGGYVSKREDGYRVWFKLIPDGADRSRFAR